jgi:uncharacterized protein YjiS (DUF1127 family)
MSTTGLTKSGSNRGSRWYRFKHCFGEWRRRAHLRDELSNLSEHSLRDIGIERRHLNIESSKTFWQI